MNTRYKMTRPTRTERHTWRDVDIFCTAVKFDPKVKSRKKERKAKEDGHNS
jgi:hypothetical protein